MSLPDVTVVTAGERRLADPVPTWAVVQGRPRFGADEELGVVEGVRLAKPAVALDEIVSVRKVPGPAFDVPLA